MKNKEEELKKCNCHCEEECCCGDECGCHEGCECDIEEKGSNTCTCEDCRCGEEEILVLKNNIEHLEAKIKLSQAELINYRKRKDEETSNMLKFANMDLILELLPVIDNFERALNMRSELTGFDKYTEGYKLLYSHMLDTLKKFGVEEIPALGLEFDPNVHEAVMIDSREESENDIVLEVFNKGYTLKGRVIRPAKVKVNKID